MTGASLFLCIKNNVQYGCIDMVYLEKIQCYICTKNILKNIV